jgi:fatty-acyl-CoA synthase
MAQGYRNRPQLTARAFADGWFHSGDLAYRDGKGYLHVLGRAEDVMNGEESLISPTALEDTLCGLPSVRYAVIVVDPERHTRIGAVVPWLGSEVNIEECRHVVRVAHGADVAKSLVIIPVERIPLTEQGKPDRQMICRMER